MPALIHTYKHRTDERGLPKVAVVHVQSTTGKAPEERGLSLYRWALYIRFALGEQIRKNGGLHKQIRRIGSV